MRGETDIGMKDGETRPEDRLTDEWIRLMENVEVQGIDIVGDQHDGIEEGHMLKD